MRADIGKELNMSVVGGAGDVVRLRLLDEREERIETAGKTFYAELRSQETDERLESVGVTYSAERDVVLTLPEMAVGQYVLVVEVSADSGARERLLSGWVTYMEPGALVKPKVDSSPDRLVGVIMDGERHRCVWYHTTAAEIAADRAEDAAGRAEDAADRAEDAADRVEDVSGELDAAVDAATKRAEDAADRAEDARDVVLGKFEETDEFIDNFFEHAARVIYPNSLTGTWWVGNRDTGEFYRGVNGKSPVVGDDGNWLTWSWDSGTWVDSGTRAAGKDGFSPHINALGLWVYFDPVSGEIVTGPPAAGRDGRDGAAVRFLLVDSYEDIPQSGETCNGGFRYLVRKEGWAVIGEPAATGNGEWEAWEVPSYLLPSEFTHLRVPGALNANGTAVYLMVRTTAGEVLGVSQNAVSWAVGDVVTWEFAEAVRVPNGAVVQMFLRTTNEGVTGAVPNEGVLMKSLLANEGVCRLRYQSQWYGGRTPYFLAWGAGASEFYDVYAWVESAEAAGWVRVDRTNELATARVYGLMKYGTDMTVVGGAPVGQNAEGQAFVPVAEFTVAGAVKVSNAFDPDTEVRNEGGSMHMSEDGVILADKARPNRFGAMRHSYGSTVGLETNPNTGEETDWGNTNAVGLQADGRTSVQVAGARQWGVVRVGTSVPQSMGMPWIIPVGKAVKGATDPIGHWDISGQLMNNLLVGGALRTYTDEGWFAAAPPGIDLARLIDDSNAVGLMTSDSFFQSASHGLELAEATASLLGGVRKMLTLRTGSDVPTGSAVVDYLNEYYYSKAYTYTRDELTRDDGVIEQELREKLPIYAEEELRAYAKITWCTETFAPAADVRVLSATVSSNKASVDNSIEALMDRVARLESSTDYVRVGNSGLRELWKGTRSEFSKLGTIRADVSYDVLEG